jgi:hypothetical protein
MTRSDDCTMTPAQWAELDAREADMARRAAGYMSCAEAARVILTASLWGVALGWLLSRALMWGYGL